MIYAEDRLRRTIPQDPVTRPGGEGDGPSKPDVRRPDTNELIKRMKRIDPEQAKRYRQRSGE
jgi:hypothetical protein